MNSAKNDRAEQGASVDLTYTPPATGTLKTDGNGSLSNDGHIFSRWLVGLTLVGLGLVGLLKLFVLISLIDKLLILGVRLEGKTYALRSFFSAGQAVSDGVQQSGLSEAASVVIDDDGTFAMPLVAHHDLFAPQVDRCFVTVSLKAERVVLLDRTSLLGVEQFVGVLRGTEESNTR